MPAVFCAVILCVGRQPVKGVLTECLNGFIASEIIGLGGCHRAYSVVAADLVVTRCYGMSGRKSRTKDVTYVLSWVCCRDCERGLMLSTMLEGALHLMTAQYMWCQLMAC
jgi:hypothetical protein